MRPVGQQHQDQPPHIKDFADRDARGLRLRCPLAYIAAHASLIVDAFQRHNPAYRPPRS